MLSSRRLKAAPRPTRSAQVSTSTTARSGSTSLNQDQAEEAAEAAVVEEEVAAEATEEVVDVVVASVEVVVADSEADTEAEADTVVPLPDPTSPRVKECSCEQ